MKTKEKSTIYTIGHSTHPIEIFIEMLQFFEIEMLVDVRSLPGSRKFPQFNQDELKASLEKNGIGYTYMKSLGGRRKVEKNSKNTKWRNTSFQGYADYMETSEFQNGLDELKTIAHEKNTVYMCAEAVWWRCHRSMISDVLKAEGWEVLHIMAIGKATGHPYTSPARIEGDEVFYYDEE